TAFLQLMVGLCLFNQSCPMKAVLLPNPVTAKSIFSTWSWMTIFICTNSFTDPPLFSVLSALYVGIGHAIFHVGILLSLTNFSLMHDLVLPESNSASILRFWFPSNV